VASFPWIYGLLGFLFNGYFALWQKQIIDAGCTLQQLGLLIAGQTLIALAIDIPSGNLADRYGHKKISVIGLGICGGCFVLPAIHPSMSMIAVSVLGLGAGEAFINGALDSWANSLLDSNGIVTRKDSFFHREKWSAVGKIAGAIFIPVATSLLGEGIRPSWIMFSVVAAVLVVMSAGTTSDRRAPRWEPSHVEASQAPELRLKLVGLLSSPLHRFLIVATFLFGAADGIVAVGLRPQLLHLGMNQAALFGIFQAAMTGARLIGLTVYRRTGFSHSVNAVAWPLLLSAPLFLGFSLTDSLYLAIPLWLIRISLLSGYFPSLKEQLCSSQEGKRFSASVLSVYSVVGALGTAVITLGLAAAPVGPEVLRYLLVAGAVLTAASGVTYLAALVSTGIPDEVESTGATTERH
jgi:MFS family permease